LNLEPRYSARNVERGVGIRIYHAASSRLVGLRTAVRRDWVVAPSAPRPGWPKSARKRGVKESACRGSSPGPGSPGGGVEGLLFVGGR
jgi:hypothetical protein